MENSASRSVKIIMLVPKIVVELLTVSLPQLIAPEEISVFFLIVTLLLLLGLMDAKTLLVAVMMEMPVAMILVIL